MDVGALVGRRPPRNLVVGLLKMVSTLEGPRVCLWVHRRNLMPSQLWATLKVPLISVSFSRSPYSPTKPRHHTIFSESDMVAVFEDC